MFTCFAVQLWIHSWWIALFQRRILKLFLAVLRWNGNELARILSVWHTDDVGSSSTFNWKQELLSDVYRKHRYFFVILGISCVFTFSSCREWSYSSPTSTVAIQHCITQNSWHSVWVNKQSSVSLLFMLSVWLSGNALVTLLRVRLVHGWVTVLGRVNHLAAEPGTQANSACAIPLSVGTMSAQQSWESKQAHHIMH